MSTDDYTNHYRGSTVLVTGGAGFIGSHLCHRLAELGANVRVIDDLSSGYATNLPEGTTLIQASILDRDALREAMTGCSVVFHLAAMVSVTESVESPARCMAINFSGTEAVLETAIDRGTRRMTLAASAAAYGDDPTLPCSEDQPPDSRSPYAASKVAGEQLLRSFGMCYDLSTVSLRYFNIFGPRQDPSSPYAAVISAFANALRKGTQPVIYGDGGQTRDFTYVGNVIHATLLAGASPRDLAGEVINIGTGVKTSVLTVLQEMAAVLKVDVEPEFRPERTGDVRESVADISKAREVLGYEPVVGLSEGLGRLLGG